MNNGFKAKVSGLWEAFTYLFAFNKEVVGLGQRKYETFRNPK